MSRVSSLLFGDHKSLDSFSDRLNCRYTVCILSVIAILAMVRVLISEPIVCFTPLEFTAKQSAYAEKVCWSSGTSFRQTNGFVSNVTTDYYQWIPLIFALQAFLFCLPKLFWNLTSSISGPINVRNIVGSSEIQTSGSTPDGAAQNMQYMTKCLGRHLVEFSNRWRMASSAERFWLLLSGNWTFIFYIVVKLLYVGNALGQLCLLNRFLGSEDQIGPYGFAALIDLCSERAWKTSAALPRVILCDYEIRKLGSIHRYTSMCSLPMNLWYEIIFLFLWFWIVFVAIATVASLVFFVFLQFNVFYQERYCRLRLLALSKVNEAQSVQVSQFVNNFITRDAWFVVQSVGRIFGDQKATELVCGLWENYIASKEEKDLVNVPS